ncbi:MAG: trigger factor [Lachnospiraceae bacterium]|nr:trigger factor [Lachnospiraceae bacterium]
MKKKMAVLSAVLMGVTLLSGCGKGAYSTRLPDYSEYVTLGSYENLEYVPRSVEVTDEDVQYELDNFVDGLSTEKEVTDRGAQVGDSINIDYVGTVDGVEFEGGSTGGEGTNFVLGESGYIDNFDDQLVGMKPGDTKDVKVTFPDPYEPDPDMSGKAAVFATTMNSITETETPELTDKLVADNTDCDTIEAYKEKIRADLLADAEEEAEEAATDSLLSAAVANATFSAYPEKEIKGLIEDTIASMKEEAAAYEIDYATYIMFFFGQSSEEEFEEYLADSAKQYIEQRMVACEIAKKENIVVSDEDIKAYVDSLVEEYELDSANDVYESYTDADLEYMILVDKIGELLKKTAIEVASTEESTDTEEAGGADEEDTAAEDSEDTTEEAGDDTTEN